MNIFKLKKFGPNKGYSYEQGAGILQSDPFYIIGTL